MEQMGVIGEDSVSSMHDRVQMLKEQHNQIDAKLKQEEARPLPDSLTIATLKRQKLAIKDEIAQLSDD